MTDLDWEDALEIVVSFLEAPPAVDTDAGRRVDEALLRVLAAAPPAEHAPPDMDAVARLDAGLRARLGDLAGRRARASPFGDNPDGPTLGMDLGGS